jgi:hypothetical protein
MSQLMLPMIPHGTTVISSLSAWLEMLTVGYILWACIRSIFKVRMTIKCFNWSYLSIPFKVVLCSEVG